MCSFLHHFSLSQDISTIDGIQLDDHFGFPMEMGYDLFTQALYSKENMGSFTPQDHTHEDWVNWASSKVTDLRTQIFHAIKAKQPDCLISISPNPQGFSKKQYMADWIFWEREGLAEEVVLQVYRGDVFKFVSEISKQEVIDGSAHIPLSIGILTGVKTHIVSFELIKEQLKETPERDLAGVSLVFYETIFNKDLKPQIIARGTLNLQDLFT